MVSRAPHLKYQGLDLKSLKGVDGWETLQRVMVCEKFFQVIIDRLIYDMMRHLRHLYITAHIDGKHVSRVLLDNGASINILPLSMLKKINRNEVDLILANMVMTNFIREITKPIDVLPVDIIIEGNTTMMTFFVM